MKSGVVSSLVGGRGGVATPELQGGEREDDGLEQQDDPQVGFGRRARPRIPE